MPLSLIQKQRVFTARLAQLIVFANTVPGFSVRLGEVMRTKAQAKDNAASGKGIANSAHLNQLAADLLLDIDGVYQTGTPVYAPLGVFWESLSTPDAECCWGGRFDATNASRTNGKDGNHFSVEYKGVK